MSAANEESALSAELEDMQRDAERYRWMRNHYEWRRSGELMDADSHAFVGCRFPYLANFSCAAMLDYNIDKMMESSNAPAQPTAPGELSETEADRGRGSAGAPR
jgi:hypothetical protein